MPTQAASYQVESGIDWGERWRADIAQPTLRKDEVYWSRRAHGFNALTQRGGYAHDLLSRLDLHPGDEIIDMGCGSGALSIPLAARGHKVFACDFSEVMLRQLEHIAFAAGVLDNIEPRRAFWFDDWHKLPQVDIFVAARPLYACNLPQAILNIEEHTRRRCYVSAETRLTPRHDPVMLAAIGRDAQLKAESVYLANMLAQMDRLPEVGYTSQLLPAFGGSLEEVREEFELQDGPFTDEESHLLDEFIRANFTVMCDSEGNCMLHRAYRRTVCWAFISWDVPR